MNEFEGIPKTDLVVEMPPVQPPAAPLRAIRPLMGSKAPRWTDSTQTACGCDYCQHWAPLIDKINSKLDEEGKKLLTELVDDWDHVRMDLSLAESKLDGSWPGWEKIKDFMPEEY